jgi:two-component system, OmpR family, sensor kinase
MTVQGANRRTARRWQAVRQLSSRTPLRTKLVTAVLALVAVALAVMGFVAIAVFGGYLQDQVDGQVRNLQAQVQAQVLNDPFFFSRPHQDMFVLNNSIVEVLDSSGQPVSGLGNWQNLSGVSGPDVPAAYAGPNGTSGQPVTVPAVSGGTSWRIITQPVNYSTDGGITNQSGTLVVGINLGNLKQNMAYLTKLDISVSLVILIVLAMIGFAVVRANLRPLVEIEETAGEIAAGHLNRRVPERDPRTEIGSLGRSLNIMLSQIEAAFHAREQSEAAAHQSEERMRRFIADASHELRTPLTAIRGFAEYYRQRGGLVRRWDRDHAADAGAAATGLTPDDLDRIMQRVEKEAARMGLLVEDLLLLARLDQQRPLARQHVDLLVLAADAVHDARLLAPARAIDLSVQPGAAFLVVGDEARLRQVIGNLMSNALTHTPDGTPIEVSVSSGTLDPQAGDDTPAAILDVTDHGPGMTPEQAHRAFERFYRADQARTRATGGSGLGLAIVRALVAAQGGVTSVRTALGEGATFRIALPLAPEALGHPDDSDPAEDPGMSDEVDPEVNDGLDPGTNGESTPGTNGESGSGISGEADGTGAADELPHDVWQ